MCYMMWKNMKTFFSSPKEGISDISMKHLHHVDLSEPIGILSMLRRVQLIFVSSICEYPSS